MNLSLSNAVAYRPRTCIVSRSLGKYFVVKVVEVNCTAVRVYRTGEPGWCPPGPKQLMCF